MQAIDYFLNFASAQFTAGYRHSKIQTQKDSNERLFILTWGHTMHIFFAKPQNDT